MHKRPGVTLHAVGVVRDRHPDRCRVREDRLTQPIVLLVALANMGPAQAARDVVRIVAFLDNERHAELPRDGGDPGIETGHAEADQQVEAVPGELIDMPVIGFKSVADLHMMWAVGNRLTISWITGAICPRWPNP